MPDTHPPAASTTLTDTPPAGTRPLDVVVVHETNGPKYFEAIVYLQQSGRLRSLQFYETSVLWKFVHSMLRERKSFRVALSQSLRNLRFRLSCWTMKDRIVLVGVAPWDYRMVLYAALRRTNYFVYHTSWPQWDGSVPKRYGPFTPLVRRAWLRILSESRVGIAAATELSGDSGRAAISTVASGPPKPIAVIRHVVSEAFFEHRSRFATPFRLLFLGELAEKKGLLDVVRVMDILRDEAVVIDIVGDGPLRAVAEELGQRPGCKWHGHVRDRKALAQIVANCQLLVSPGIRTGKWEELFGISIIEGMASGLPCIASDHIGPRSIITNTVDGFLLPERAPEAMAEHIRQLAHDQTAWEAMSAQAVTASRQYGLQETANRWEKLFISRLPGSSG